MIDYTWKLYKYDDLDKTEFISSFDTLKLAKEHVIKLFNGVDNVAILPSIRLQNWKYVKKEYAIFELCDKNTIVLGIHKNNVYYVDKIWTKPI